MKYWTKNKVDEFFKIVHSDVNDLEAQMHWNDHLKVGWYPIREEDAYESEYFDKYAMYEETGSGDALNDFRSQFVDMHYRGAVVDVGVGAGTFIKRRGKHNTSGYDVGERPTAWLKENGLWTDPYECSSLTAITCWDSLEHIRDYRPLLAKVSEWVFISIPVFVDRFHASRSKHFRPTEHWWYFTDESMVGMMQSQGFKLVSHSNMEQKLGREDIGSFAFRRVSRG